MSELVVDGLEVAGLGPGVGLRWFSAPSTMKEPPEGESYALPDPAAVGVERGVDRFGADVLPSRRLTRLGGAGRR